MCTLSWWSDDERRGVLFNRDEKRTRAHGLPPEKFQTATDKQILMPSDPEAGGTWIGVNDRGLIVALLNYYPHYQSEIVMSRSRGLLVVDLLKQCNDSQFIPSILEQLNLSVYRGFLLFAMDIHSDPQVVSWDGKTLKNNILDKNEPNFLTTSSFQSEVCMRERKQLFKDVPDDPDALAKVHSRFDPKEPHIGPLVVREDAATESLTEIKIEERGIEITYRTVRGNPPQFSSPDSLIMPLSYKTSNSRDVNLTNRGDGRT